MSTLGIQLAVCLELSAKLKPVKPGEPTESSEKAGRAMYFAGVDVAKRRHEVCIIDDSGNVVLQLPVLNTHSGLQKLLGCFSNQTDHQ